MTTVRWMLVAALVVACSKEGKPDKEGEAATGGTASGSGSGSGGGTGGGTGGGKSGSSGGGSDDTGGKSGGGGGGTAEPAQEVVAPTAADLTKYTEDLKGAGPLMARIKTSMGEINCELFEKGAPLTVANFVGLARGLHPFLDPRDGKVKKQPFYDGLIFHRVIPEFMIQGGDPLGQGNGGPGYEFAQEVSPELKHAPGVLSMANAGPGTNGSQFFIMEVDKAQLDGGYNVFGKCAEVDVVKAIARVDRNGQDRPATDVVMEKVEIYRK